MGLIPAQAVVLKKGRERSVLRRHPWIFSGAIEKAPSINNIGETVAVFDSQNSFLAWAAYNPNSQISCRIWSWDESETIADEFLHQRLFSAWNFREDYLRINQDCVTSAIRLVHAESDGLPGLIVDQYEDILVTQFLSAGADYWKKEIVQQIKDITGITKIYERSDVDVRQLEGLPMQVGVLQGEQNPHPVVIHENDIKYRVDTIRGQKTGFFLDQRANRRIVSKFAKGCEVLDCFCYSGGFTCASIAGEAASIISIDSSAEALDMLKANLQLNNYGHAKVDVRQGDVFQVLREFRDRGKFFDLIILDPPKFAQSASQVERAARGYKDINLLALKLLRRNGLLATFSCSGSIDDSLFQKIVAGAALDAGVNARVIQHLHQDFDHPVALNFPEGAYLKGLLIKVV